MTLLDLFLRNGHVPDTKGFVLIINSELKTVRGRAVRVKIETGLGDKPPKLVFYYESGGQRAYLSNMEKNVIDALTSNVLYDIKFPGEVPLESCVVNVCSAFGCIFCETRLYNVVRKYVEMDSRDPKGAMSYVRTQKVGSIALPDDMIRRLAAAFRAKSYNIYTNLVCSRVVMPRLLNGGASKAKSKFFNIMKTFIPVFVECDYFYNPFKYNAAFTGSKLYRDASRTQRVVEIADGISVRYLTHKEICEDLGMSVFMRFNIRLLLLLIISLTRAGEDYVSGEPQYRYKSGEVVEGLRRYYTAADFEREVMKYAEKSHTDLKISLTAYEERRASLVEYVPRDALFVFCMDNAKVLTSFGPVAIDDRANTTPERLYGYLQEAQLIRGGGSLYD